MTEVLTCEYCETPITGHVFELRLAHSEPVHVFDTPTCRKDFKDGYGLTPADWADAPHYT